MNPGELSTLNYLKFVVFVTLVASKILANSEVILLCLLKLISFQLGNELHVHVCLNDSLSAKLAYNELHCYNCSSA